MKRLLLALAAGLFACAGQAATLPATPSNLAAVFAKAQAGDTMTLAPGSYGWLDLGRKFTSTVSVQPADPANPPVVAGVAISGASNITVSGLSVAFAPTLKTTTWDSAVLVTGSDHITLAGLKVTGGNAISGASEDGTHDDAVGNILGRPTARGITISYSSDVTVDGAEVQKFFKGIVVFNAQKVMIRKSEIHHNRTTAIVGWNISDLVVDGNYLHDAAPWAWNKTAPGGTATYGDHADFLALWSDGGQTTPNARVKVINNRMEQLQGEAILGMWFQGEPASFTDFEVSGNRIVVNNLQGISLSNSGPGLVANNVLRRASAGNAGQSPTLLLRGTSAGVAVTGNTIGAPIDDKTGKANPASGNTVVAGDANIYALAGPAPVSTPTVVKVALPTAPDTRDAQIAELTARLSTAAAALRIAQDGLAASQAQVGSLTGQQTALTAARDAALADLTADRAALAAIQAGAAAALASNPTGR